MPGSHGNFVWYELMTTDPEAAKTFYGTVVGWSMQEMSNAGMPYTILMAGDAMAAGLMGMPPDAKGARATGLFVRHRDPRDPHDPRPPSNGIPCSLSKPSAQRDS